MINKNKIEPINKSEGQESKPKNIFVLALLFLVMIYMFLFWITQKPPEALPVDADQNVFSAGRAMQQLRNILVDNKPHPVDSKANNAVRNRILERLKQLEIETEVQRQQICRPFGLAQSLLCITVENIIAVLPGKIEGPSILLSAHYDSVGAGPGVSDNGASVSTTLEIARILKRQKSFKNTVLILFSDAEEFGLQGASAFLKHHPLAKNVAVVLNMDARGSRGMSAMFETGKDNAWLIELIAHALERPVTNSALSEIFRYMPHTTDFTVYKKAGMLGLNFAFASGASHYHTSIDGFEQISSGTVQHHGDNVLAITLALLNIKLTDHQKGNASYLDIGTWKMVYWPEELSPYLAGFGLLIVILAIGRFYQRRKVSLKTLSWGGVTWAALITAAVLAGVILTLFLSAMRGTPQPWYSYSLPVEISLWTLTVVVMIWVARALVHRTSAYGLLSAIWLVYALVTVIVSVFLSGVEAVFVLSLIPASICLLIISFLKDTIDTRPGQLLVILMSVVVALVWFPFSIIIEIMLGLSTGLAITVPGFFIISSLLVLPNFSGRLLSTILSMLCLLAIVVALIVPVYTSTSPQPINILHFTDSDKGTAKWAIDSPLSSPPEQVLQILQEGNIKLHEGKISAWGSDHQKYFIASAEKHEQPVPDLKLLERKVNGNYQEMTMQFLSQSEGDAFGLVIPEKAQAKFIRFPGIEVPQNFKESIGGYNRYYCIGQACNGQIFTLVLENKAPIEYIVEEIKLEVPHFSEELINAREVSGSQISFGDKTIIVRRFTY